MTTNGEFDDADTGVFATPPPCAGAMSRVGVHSDAPIAAPGVSDRGPAPRLCNALRGTIPSSLATARLYTDSKNADNRLDCKLSRRDDCAWHRVRGNTLTATSQQSYHIHGLDAVVVHAVTRRSVPGSQITLVRNDDNGELAKPLLRGRIRRLGPAVEPPGP